MPPILSPEIEQLIAAQVPDVVRIRHDLHAHPQLGFEETFASRVVQEELGRADVPFQAGVAGTGVVGWLVPPGQEGRPAVALRADMDALPIQEATGRTYASEVSGKMHACGHDGHTAILIGAARVLGRLRDKLPRPVKLLFQPAEEGMGGGEKMFRAGALEEEIGGLKVGSIYALHGWTTTSQGVISTRKGPIMAAADRLTIQIRGRGGHGAGPQHTADPIVAAAQVVTALQSIVSRNVAPAQAAVVTIGTIRGGTAVNVIPETVQLTGTIRTLDDAVAEKVHRRLSEIVQHVSAGMGCTADVQIERYYPVTCNDPTATDYVLRVAREVVGESAVKIEEQAEMGSEDFAYYSRQVPGCFFFLGLRPPGATTYPNVHSPTYDFNDEVVLPGMRMMVAIALAAAEAPGV